MTKMKRFLSAAFLALFSLTACSACVGVLSNPRVESGTRAGLGARIRANRLPAHPTDPSELRSEPAAVGRSVPGRIPLHPVDDGLLIRGEGKTRALRYDGLFHASDAMNGRHIVSGTAPQDRELDADGDGDVDDTDLALAVQNPLSALISVPIQGNLDFGIGPRDAERLTFNVQPVIPFELNDDWSLITRTILPITYQDSPAPGIESEFGLGDTLQSFFFSPNRDYGGWIVGAGPIALWPTATEPSLGSGKLGLGPTALALRQSGGWTYGALANHLWSVAGSSGRDEVSQTIVQPFVAHTWPTATSLGVSAEGVHDWTDHQWTIPVSAQVSQIVLLGGQPLSLSLGGRYFAEGPSGGPEWGVRFMVTLLFPR